MLNSKKDFMIVVLITLYSVTVIRNQYSHSKSLSVHQLKHVLSLTKPNQKVTKKNNILINSIDFPMTYIFLGITNPTFF